MTSVLLECNKKDAVVNSSQSRWTNKIPFGVEVNTGDVISIEQVAINSVGVGADVLEIPEKETKQNITSNSFTFEYSKYITCAGDTCVLLPFRGFEFIADSVAPAGSGVHPQPVRNAFMPKTSGNLASGFPATNFLANVKTGSIWNNNGDKLYLLEPTGVIDDYTKPQTVVYPTEYGVDLKLRKQKTTFTIPTGYDSPANISQLITNQFHQGSLDNNSLYKPVSYQDGAEVAERNAPHFNGDFLETIIANQVCSYGPTQSEATFVEQSVPIYNQLFVAQPKRWIGGANLLSLTDINYFGTFASTDAHSTPLQIPQPVYWGTQTYLDNFSVPIDNQIFLTNILPIASEFDLDDDTTLLKIAKFFSEAKLYVGDYTDIDNMNNDLKNWVVKIDFGRLRQAETEGTTGTGSFGKYTVKREELTFNYPAWINGGVPGVNDMCFLYEEYNDPYYHDFFRISPNFEYFTDPPIKSPANYYDGLNNEVILNAADENAGYRILQEYTYNFEGRPRTIRFEDIQKQYNLPIVFYNSDAEPLPKMAFILKKTNSPTGYKVPWNSSVMKGCYIGFDPSVSRNKCGLAINGQQADNESATTLKTYINTLQLGAPNASLEFDDTLNRFSFKNLHYPQFIGNEPDSGKPSAGGAPAIPPVADAGQEVIVVNKHFTFGENPDKYDADEGGTITPITDSQSGVSIEDIYFTKVNGDLELSTALNWKDTLLDRMGFAYETFNYYGYGYNRYDPVYQGKDRRYTVSPITTNATLDTSFNIGLSVNNYNLPTYKMGYAGKRQTNVIAVSNGIVAERLPKKLAYPVLLVLSNIITGIKYVGNGGHKNNCLGVINRSYIESDFVYSNDLDLKITATAPFVITEITTEILNSDYSPANINDETMVIYRVDKPPIMTWADLMREQQSRGR